MTPQACVAGWCCKYSNEFYSQRVQHSSCSAAGATLTIAMTKTITKASTTTTAPGGVSTGGAAVGKLEDYGARTTGGGSGPGTTVTACSGLASAVAAGGVIKVSGILSGCGIIKLNANTSITGVGSNSGKFFSPLVMRATNPCKRNDRRWSTNQGYQ